MKSPVHWTDSHKKTFCVMASSALALPVSLGAVYTTDRFLPGQMHWLKEKVATHIVEPHIEAFDKLTKNLKKAHDRYDEKRNGQLAAQGLPIPPAGSQTVHERAKDIAGKMITFATALTADVGASIVIQQNMNKALKVCTDPCRTCFAEGAVQLLLTAALPTVFARSAENVHFGIAKHLNKSWGVDKKPADDIAISTTYVALPGLVSAAAALFTAHGGFKSRQ